ESGGGVFLKGGKAGFFLFGDHFGAAREDPTIFRRPGPVGGAPSKKKKKGGMSLGLLSCLPPGRDGFRPALLRSVWREETARTAGPVGDVPMITQRRDPIGCSLRGLGECYLCVLAFARSCAVRH